MRISQIALGAALTAGLSMGMAGIQKVSAQDTKEYVSKAEVKRLVQTPLAGMDGKEVNIVHILAPPGFVGGRHLHPAPVFVYVISGTLTAETDEGTKTFTAGEVYSEPLSQPMRGRNLSASENLELLAFQVGDIGKPMMLKAE